MSHRGHFTNQRSSQDSNQNSNSVKVKDCTPETAECPTDKTLTPRMEVLQPISTIANSFQLGSTSTSSNQDYNDVDMSEVMGEGSEEDCLIIFNKMINVREKKDAK